ncbi:MAG: hypothetical protein JXL84_04145 [Deltaproteobacteria bacterium]|nr:hypothetical protein [Deltaproteobacteria bacterium]
MKKGFVIIGLMVFMGVTLFCGVNPPLATAQVRKPPAETTPPKMAHPFWIEGKVTAKPREEGGGRYLQVDGKNFRVMPDIRIARLVENQPGIVNEIQLDFHQIRKGQKVNMKVLGDRVQEIQIPLKQ